MGRAGPCAVLVLKTARSLSAIATATSLPCWTDIFDICIYQNRLLHLTQLTSLSAPLRTITLL